MKWFSAKIFIHEIADNKDLNYISLVDKQIVANKILEVFNNSDDILREEPIITVEENPWVLTISFIFLGFSSPKQNIREVAKAILGDLCADKVSSVVQCELKTADVAHRDGINFDFTI